MSAEELTIATPAGPVSGLLADAPRAAALLVLAHGAGAGMRHAFMEALAVALAEAGVSTLRFQFPYMERGGHRTDPPAVATAAVRAAVESATSLRPDLPLFAGGKSFGGRMTSTAAADAGLPVRGIVFVGFPLHPAGRPATARGDHLDRVTIPMLFLQGTRDDLARIDLIREVTGRLGDRATLHEIDEAGHGLGVPKRTGRTAADVIRELAEESARWMARV